MKLKLEIFFLAAFLCVPITKAQQRLLTDSLYAPSIDRTSRFMVLLPMEYDTTQRYPALYLLHGLGGNYTNWTSSSKIADYSARSRIIIVMPDGGSSWYANSVSDRSDKYEDYLCDDLQAYVQRKYSIDTLRQGIAGLSMGGYGSLVQGVRHPEKYIFAGSLSGSVNVPRDIEQREKNSATVPTVWNLRRIFGEPSSPARSAYDLLTLSANADPDSLPYFYLAIGIQDPLPRFLVGHRDLVDLFSKRGIAYEYHETPGAHTWTYWDKEIQPLLVRFEEVQRTGYRPLAKTLEAAAVGGDTIEIRKLFRRLRANPKFLLDEDEMNALGHRLLGSKKFGEAIEVLSLNAETFAGSATAWGSLGEAYTEAGDPTQAISCYRRALELNPSDRSVAEKLETLKNRTGR